MAYDLRSEPWIPYRRRSGRVEWGAPTLLTDALDDDPVVAFAAPRADFDGALHEFLIGLLTAALLPNDEDAWHARWRMPPTPAELRDALNALPAAFDLDGLGPRVFQDFSAGALADKKWTKPIASLLVEAPGKQTVDDNKDLFIKRGAIVRLGRPATAMALVTMQAYAPSGGQGHRTSMRGGGPLTTLVDPRRSTSGPEAEPLWGKLWANVATSQQLAEYSANDNAFRDDFVFPWLAETRTSENDHGTALADAHPLQAYFGLPRRIRIDFDGEGCCDLTGSHDAQTAARFRMRNYGVQYVKWQHPLSPYRYANTQWLPMHGQSDGVGWKDWAAVTCKVADTDRQPARAVSHFIAHRAALIGSREFGVHAFGYDTEKATVRGWIDAVLPAFAVTDPDQRSRLVALAERLTRATDVASSALLAAVQCGTFAPRKSMPGDDKLAVRNELWEATTSAFYARLRAATAETNADARGDAGAVVGAACAVFRSELEHAALALFDRRCPAAGLALDAMRRVVGARFSLVKMLHGRSEAGRAFWTALGLPAPAASAKEPSVNAAHRAEAKRGKAAKPSTPTSV